MLLFCPQTFLPLPSSPLSSRPPSLLVNPPPPTASGPRSHSLPRPALLCLWALCLPHVFLVTFSSSPLAVRILSSVLILTYLHVELSKAGWCLTHFSSPSTQQVLNKCSFIPQ